MKTTKDETLLVIGLVARAKAFHQSGARWHRFMIETDGTVRVWDPVGRYYSIRHGMKTSAIRRIRKLARRESELSKCLL